MMTKVAAGEALGAILIVEDNETLAGGLRANFEVEGYSVEVALNGEDAVDSITRATPDIMILDLALPGISGFEVLKRIRASGSDLPVLVLSARDQEVDKVQGFRLGADDYVVKPVGALELIARVAAMLRRAARRSAGPKAGSSRKLLRFGDIEIDTDDRTVKREGSLVEMSPREFDLLVRLYEAGGKLVSRQALMGEIWGYALGVTSRTLDQHIARLRNKIEPRSDKPEYIVTVRKSGYRLRR